MINNNSAVFLFCWIIVLRINNADSLWFSISLVLNIVRFDKIINNNHNLAFPQLLIQLMVKYFHFIHSKECKVLHYYVWKRTVIYYFNSFEPNLFTTYLIPNVIEPFSIVSWFSPVCKHAPVINNFICWKWNKIAYELLCLSQSVILLLTTNCHLSI